MHVLQTKQGERTQTEARALFYIILGVNVQFMERTRYPEHLQFNVLQEDNTTFVTFSF